MPTEPKLELVKLYLEQGLMSLQEAGWDHGKINLVRQIFGEKMSWAYDAGREDGVAQGIEMAEDAIGKTIASLQES